MTPRTSRSRCPRSRPSSGRAASLTCGRPPPSWSGPSPRRSPARRRARRGSGLDPRGPAFGSTPRVPAARRPRPRGRVALARETPGLVGLNARLPDLLGGGPDRAVHHPRDTRRSGQSRPRRHPARVRCTTGWRPPVPSITASRSRTAFGRWTAGRPALPARGYGRPSPSPSSRRRSPTATQATPARCTCAASSHAARTCRRWPPAVRLDLTASVGPGGQVTVSVPAVAVATNAPGSARGGHRRPRSRRLGETGPDRHGALGRQRTGDLRPQPARRCPGRRPAGAGATGAPRHPGGRPAGCPRAVSGRPDVDRDRGTAYRVYASDETTLRQRLDALVAAGTPGAEAMRTALGTASSARSAQESSAPTPHSSTGRASSCSTPSVLLAATAGQMSYRHEVSGSLDVLVSTRCCRSQCWPRPRSSSSARDGVRRSTLVVRGVPNSARRRPRR